MSEQNLKISLAEQLRVAAASYQEAQVIPHCAVCAKPCCALESLVLELNWREVKALWRLDESRSAFDRRLASGKGPQAIRAGNGLYYAHRQACPAYDQVGHCCRVYGQDSKPPGCSDFPVYEDGGCLMADLRCEAVTVDALVAWVAERLGAEYRIVQSADREFPFLVTLSVRRQGSKPSHGKRRQQA